jgi:hypothetical protein
MVDLERDLDRLLSGDQNVGFATAAAPSLAAAEAGAGPRRWHLLAAGAVVIAAGVTIALRHPATSDGDPRAPPAIPQVVEAHQPASPAPARAVESPAGRLSGASAAASEPSSPGARSARAAAVANRHKPGRGERKASNASAPRPEGRIEPSESAKRGVLPLRSREAYPDP